MDKPIKHYPGSKEAAGTYQTIINWIPPHQTYIDPFLGKGTIFLYKKLSGVTVINDIDTGIMESWSTYINDCMGPGNVRVLNIPSVQLLSTVLPGTADTFVYMDPPYMLSTRKGGKIYKHEMTDNDHEELLAMATTAKFNCMISCYDNDLYKDLLKDWNKHSFNSTTRGGVARETIYMNYEYPTALHDYRYLGVDCWDRQRIKRKINRHVSRLNKLPVHERKAILESLSRL